MIKFKIGNIPVSIHPFFWLIVAAISWLNAKGIPEFMLWSGIIFISILVHELGHAITAQAFGQKAHIYLLGFGGLTKGKGLTLPLWKEFLVVLNGPLAGLSLAALAWIIGNYTANIPTLNASSLFLYALTVTKLINISWTILNLIPVQPLDGSKLLSIILEGIFGLLGAKIALFISFLLAGVLGVVFFLINMFFLGAIFFLFAFESFRSWKSSLELTDRDQDFILQHMLKEAQQDIKNHHIEEALQKLQRIRQLAKAGVIYLSATEQAAHLLLEKGDGQTAYNLLWPIKSKLSPEALRMLHQLAYNQGELQAAISLGDKAFQSYPSYDIAVINALSHSLLGQVRPAIGWLQCALQQGLPDLRTLLAKKEFDPIREDPIFREFRDRAQINS